MKQKSSHREAQNDIFSKIDTFRLEDVSDEASLAKLRRRKTVTINGIERYRINYSGRYGKKGLGYYGFHEPNGICVADENCLVVADTNKSLLMVFDSSGGLVKRVGGLTYPHKVAICPFTGNIVVTERSPNNQVKIFHPDWKLVRTFGSDIIKHPRGLAVDSIGNIFVLESMNMRVIIFDRFGNLLHIFEDKASFPNDITIYEDREIFVCDNGANLILVYNYLGEKIDSIGEGAIEHPVGVKISKSGLIVVGDNHNSFKITVFDREGTVVCGFESIPKLSSCLDIALSSNDILYVSSRDNNIYVYDLRAPWQNWSRKVDNKNVNKESNSSPLGNQLFVSEPPVSSNSESHYALSNVATNLANGQPSSTVFRINAVPPNLGLYNLNNEYPLPMSKDTGNRNSYQNGFNWSVNLDGDCYKPSIDSKLADCLQLGLNLGNENHIAPPRNRICYPKTCGLVQLNDHNLRQEVSGTDGRALRSFRRNADIVPLSDALDWSAYSRALSYPWMEK